jgi:hypothetical protein
LLRSDAARIAAAEQLAAECPTDIFVVQNAIRGARHSCPRYALTGDTGLTWVNDSIASGLSPNIRPLVASNLMVWKPQASCPKGNEMSRPKYALTHDELDQAEVQAMRLILSIVLKVFFDEHQRRDAALQEIQHILGPLVAQLPLEHVAPARRDAFRDSVIDRARHLMDDAQSFVPVKPRRR